MQGTKKGEKELIAFLLMPFRLSLIMIVQMLHTTSIYNACNLWF